MRKITFAILLFTAIGLLSLKDNGACPGVSGYKALACSSCHGGSISGVVFIPNGKDEENTNGENTFEYLVRVPSSNLNFLQLFSSSNNDAYGAPRVEVDFTSALAEVKNSTLFNAINLWKEKSTKAYTELRVRYTFDEPITSARTMILQGVLSNNDGTAFGDETFYKEIVIEPKESDMQSLDLSIAYDQAYYNNNQVIISNPGKVQAVQIFNLQGKLVQATIVEDYQVIDVSNLEQGVYLVLLSAKLQDRQSFKFVK